MNKENVIKKSKSQSKLWWVLTGISIVITCVLVIYFIIKVSNSVTLTPELQGKFNNSAEPIGPYVQQRLIIAKEFIIYPFVSLLASALILIKAYRVQKSEQKLKI